MIAVKKQIVPLLLMVLLALTLLPTALAAEDGVRVAVIDTGISTAAIDPASVAEGVNYIRPQDSTEDKLGHGTAVAAIIVGSEAARMEGICPTAALVPLVYCSKNEIGQQVGGDTAMVAQAIYDAIDVYGCKIINISSGATGGSERLRAAVAYAEEKGVLVVSSAGNSQETAPGAVYYPGGYESVLCVGACDSGGAIASFSQQNDTVDLLALGTDLRLATIKGTRIRGQGTSFSAAIVTGAAAQIWTNHPGLTASEVRAAVLDSTRTADGWQVLDLEAALAWPPEAEKPAFSDVPQDAPFYDAVLWAVENDITGGTGGGQFSPAMTCSRAQIVTLLWRAKGEPEPTTKENPFHDIGESDWFYKAVLWAVEQGITLGTSDTTFSPHAPCTEAQVLTFLWRALGRPECGTAAAPNALYYEQAVLWATEQGFVDEAGFSAAAPAPRAHIVAYLYACRTELLSSQKSNEEVPHGGTSSLLFPAHFF